MTRISATIRPIELCDQMLRAEHREIKRIPNKIAKRLAEGKEIILHDQPEQFKLGDGHEKFFYTRIKYLHERWKEIHKECLERGFDMTDYTGAFTQVPDEYYNDWHPDYDVVRPVVVERVNRQIDRMIREPLYFSEKISREVIKLEQ